MTAKEWFDKGMERLKTFDVRGLLPSLRAANEGAIEDVSNTNGCAFYQWSISLIDVMKPKQVLELGGAMGVWSICALHTLPQESKLYSITLPEGGLEFSYIVDKYTNFFPILGDDLDMKNWEGVDLSKTDLWFIDSLHEKEHLEKELNLYSPFFKKGAIILFDDIHINNGMEEVWKEIRNKEWDCYDATDPLHYSGFGICKV